jgi:hypothetical protein
MQRAAVYAIATCVWLIISSCSSKEKVIGLREYIHHDDFEYSVQHVDKVDRIGDMAARGIFYVVSFQVENRAQRVNHRWSNKIAYLVDETGAKYENSVEAQKELQRVSGFGYKDEYVTPAGATETTMLVFDVPRHATQPYLRIRGDLLMGDVFDANQYKRTKVQLF